MSPENVQIVRQIYAALNDHRLDALPELSDPEFTWYPNPDDPEQEPRVGHDETAAFLETHWKVLPGLHTEIEEAIEAGRDVVTVVRHTARVPDSDSEIERHEAHVWSLRNGKAVRLREFPTRVEALEAARLRE